MPGGRKGHNMKVNEIYLTETEAEALIDKTEKYNRLHPDEQISFQMMAERLLSIALFNLEIEAWQYGSWVNSLTAIFFLDTVETLHYTVIQIKEKHLYLYSTGTCFS